MLDTHVAWYYVRAGHAFFVQAVSSKLFYSGVE